MVKDRERSKRKKIRRRGNRRNLKGVRRNKNNSKSWKVSLFL